MLINESNEKYILWLYIELVINNIKPGAEAEVHLFLNYI